MKALTTELLLPQNDVEDPELSIVIPALNEELTIGEFLDWCHEGLAAAHIRGEILIIDSGSDRTTQIALSRGARVLKTPKRGLGRAYIDALPHIRGRFSLLGDCDCTYDFRRLLPFVEKWREGYEFVMGSRFTGSIEPGAMPPLHRYLGTPVTTWILNIIYGRKFTDIHCGMRGISTSGFRRMNLQSQSWEYASEMIVKSVLMKLRTAEVPIHFLKDKEGRLSHHKRSGWLSPWKAAWINLRAMFIYGASFFLYRPGLILLGIGLTLVFSLAGGPVTIGRIEFSLYWMLLGVSFTIFGLQCLYMGILAQVFFDYDGGATKKWLSVFRYDRSLVLSFLLFLLGIALSATLLLRYVNSEYRLETLDHPSSYLAVLGLTSMIAAFMNFTFTLMLHAGNLSLRDKETRAWQ